MAEPRRRQLFRLLGGAVFALLLRAPAEGKDGGNPGQGNGNAAGNPGQGNGNAGGQGGNGSGNGGGEGGAGGGKPGKGNSESKGGKSQSQKGGQGTPHSPDQDRVLEAVREGRALPLRDFLPWVEARYKARVIDVELRETGGKLLYELKMLSGAGRIFVVSVDATTGRPGLLGF